ncbi:MAG: MBL fold metallo-hydrolase [Methanoregula sp.]|nr:MAG: MBL fold metallo-hydrolase [Methanoregula sp.]
MQVSPHVHALRLPFKIPVAPGIVLDRFVNVFMICGRTITLVDTGVAGCGRVIFDYIRSTGRDPAEISLIVQTHAHPDHIGATQEIQQATGCTVAIHAAEQRWIEDVSLQNRERPVPGFDVLVGGPANVGRVLEDGDVLDLDGDHLLDLVVFHTPGHSPGSVSLLLKSGRILFSGDAVPVPGNLPVYDDVPASVRSIKRLKNIDGVNVLLSSWDEPREGICAYQRMTDALAWLRKIHDAVIAAAGMGTPDPMDLCRRTAGTLGLPPQAVTPLLARTFMANLRARDGKDLFGR